MRMDHCAREDAMVSRNSLYLVYSGTESGRKCISPCDLEEVQKSG